MAVVNIAFDLAPEIVEGLATGAYKLFGGIVRDQAGRIVCHLPEAVNAIEASQAVFSVAQTTTKAVTKTPIAKTAVTTTTKKAPSLFRTIGHFAKAHPVGTAITVATVLSARVMVFTAGTRTKNRSRKNWIKHQIVSSILTHCSTFITMLCRQER